MMSVLRYLAGYGDYCLYAPSGRNWLPSVNFLAYRFDVW